jgi:RNA polymerase sigma factor (sigma-70 family)
MGELDAEVSDAELMAQFYRCHAPAFDTLTERWWRRMFGFFTRLGFSRDAAADLTQETVIKLYGTKETMSFDPRQPLAPFLMTIARRLAIRDWRRQGSRPPDVSLRAAEAVAAPDPAADSVHDDLLHCVGQLPELERTYIVLCGKHGLGECSHNEIAELLGKWPAQVTGISQRARARMRRLMQDRGY